MRDESTASEKIFTTAWHSLRCLPLVFLDRDDKRTLHSFRLAVSVSTAAYYPETRDKLSATTNKPPYLDPDSPFMDAYRSLKLALATATSTSANGRARNSELCLADGFDALTASEHYTGAALDGPNYPAKDTAEQLCSQITNKIERELDRLRESSQLTEVLANEPLWPSQFNAMELGHNYAFSEAFDTFDLKAASTPETWGFWRNWYQGFIDGKPLNWNLQRRVATEISDATWDAGPEAVAAEIERIRAEFGALHAGKERFPKHEPSSVNHLFENRVIASAGLQGLAAQVTYSIERFHAETGANALPEALEPLTALPALLLAVNSTIQEAPRDRAIASETEDQLRAEIGRLNAKVAQLENELLRASAAKPSVFSDAFKKQLGTSLGDWKLYAALCTGLWFVSGDTEGTQRRLENISHYRDMIFGDVSSPSKAASTRTTAAAESVIEI
ncbi:hypothetical protein [Leisingera sp. JC11]|uniref:hypothetical protein n=1 Tax=Leisingera sp. JC11 TaxID=3042469 RepID=UPI003453B92A